MNKQSKMFKAIKQKIDDVGMYRSSIGGNAIIPEGKTIPLCQNCGRELILFLQFDVEERFSLPFISGSRFVLFACPHCNDIPSSDIYEKCGFLLPDNFWETARGHFFTALYRPGQVETELKQLPYLQPFQLNFVSFGPLNGDTFLQDTIRIGGGPDWFQNPEEYTCSCGTQMEFICQISQDFSFLKRPETPEQEMTYSNEEYNLFIGNEIYIFACPNQCHERAVWIVVQN